MIKCSSPETKSFPFGFSLHQTNAAASCKLSAAFILYCVGKVLATSLILLFGSISVQIFSRISSLFSAFNLCCEVILFSRFIRANAEQISTLVAHQTNFCGKIFHNLPAEIERGSLVQRVTNALLSQNDIKILTPRVL